jgi:O-methyltransferase involved in polyketide biosynthesis
VFRTKIATAGRTIVFDYLDKDAFIPEKPSPQRQKAFEFLQKIGEQMKKDGFNPASLAENLTSLGFRLHENLSPKDIEERYLHERPDGHLEYVHFACAVTE